MRKRIITTLIQFAVLIIVLETILRIIYFQKNANDSLAIIAAYKSLRFRATENYGERLLEYHNRVNPNEALENKRLVEEVIESNSFEYSPYVDFKTIDFEGKYVNTNNFLRKSIPDKFINRNNQKPIKIFLLGGSTTFGFNVRDSETIASALVKTYSAQCSSCRSIEVYNYGVLSYHSYNELTLLTRFIFTGNKPDVVIFLDGLNDLFMNQASRKQIPWYYYRLKEHIRNEKDSTLSLFQLEKNEKAEKAAKEVVDKLFTNYEHARQLGKIYNIKPLFFIQPVPYHDYPNRKNDPIVDTMSLPVVEAGYKILEKECDSSKSEYYLGDMLQSEQGLPFIDHFHYSPYMNKRIADEIYRQLAPEINATFQE